LVTSSPTRKRKKTSNKPDLFPLTAEQHQGQTTQTSQGQSAGIGKGKRAKSRQIDITAHAGFSRPPQEKQQMRALRLPGSPAYENNQACKSPLLEGGIPRQFQEMIPITTDDDSLFPL